jgi:hypothetical protein
MSHARIGTLELNKKIAIAGITTQNFKQGVNKNK